MRARLARFMFGVEGLGYVEKEDAGVEEDVGEMDGVVGEMDEGEQKY